MRKPDLLMYEFYITLELVCFVYFLSPLPAEVFAAEILELDVDDPEGLLTQPAKGRLTFHAMTVPGDDEDDNKKKKKKKKKSKKKSKKREKGVVDDNDDDDDVDGDDAHSPSAELYTLTCNVEVRHSSRVRAERPPVMKSCVFCSSFFSFNRYIEIKTERRVYTVN